jgi:aminoglycoside phosphotransferase (APT) family kinase protein
MSPYHSPAEETLGGVDSASVRNETGKVAYQEGWEWPALVAAVAAMSLPESGWMFVASSRKRAAFRCACAGTFAKVTTPEGIDRMVTETAFARWAHDAGVPVAALLGDVVEQPVLGSFGAATFWALYEPVATEAVDMAWMGRTLAGLHAVKDRLALPPWDPASWFDTFMGRLRSTGLDTDLVHRLASRGGRIIDRSGDLAASAQMVVLHGDAYPDNVVASDSGPRLIDFELAQLGPAEFDLAPTVVLARRFGFPQSSSLRLLRSYGDHDPELLNVMVDLLELRVTCGAVAIYSQHNSFRTELRVRVDSLGDAGQTEWTPHRRLLDGLSNSKRIRTDS